MASSGKPGDFVYIHSSGHGTTIPLSGELALPLLVATEKFRLRYLRGLELARLITNMTNNRMTVTPIPDCYISGGVARRPHNWYLYYDSELDLVSDFDKRDWSTISEDRDSCMRPNWPIGPDYCTILTAYGPTEIVYYMRVHCSLHGIVTSCCPAGREDCWPTPTTFLCALTLIENHTLVYICHYVLNINRKDYLNSRSCGIEPSF